MNFIAKACRAFLVRRARFFSIFYLWRARIITEVIWQGKFEFKRGCKFIVPVRTTVSSGRIQLGQNIHLGFDGAPRLGTGEILLQARNPQAIICIGDNSFFSNNVSIIACTRIEIGKNFLCGDQVTIFDSDFHEVNPEMRHMKEGKSIPVKIGQNVWIGSRCLIAKGASIGDDSVIAAGSVVCGTIPARCIAAGVPARVIRNI